MCVLTLMLLLPGPKFHLISAFSFVKLPVSTPPQLLTGPPFPIRLCWYECCVPLMESTSPLASLSYPRLILYVPFPFAGPLVLRIGPLLFSFRSIYITNAVL